MEHTYGKHCDCGNDKAWHDGLGLDYICDLCDGPCKAVEPLRRFADCAPTRDQLVGVCWPVDEDFSEAGADYARERRDALIRGASRFMESGTRFGTSTNDDGTVSRVVGYDPATSTFQIETGQFSVPYKPAEGRGDTVIPAGTPLDDAVRRTQGDDMMFKWDGSIPPGISTDPTKPVIEAMPNTALQNMRQSAIDSIAAYLRFLEALEKWEAYQSCILSSRKSD